MIESLPISFTPDVHAYAIRLSQCYRPHDRIPTRQELLANQYEQPSYVGIRELTKQLGIDYNQRIKSRR